MLFILVVRRDISMAFYRLRQIWPGAKTGGRISQLLKMAKKMNRYKEGLLIAGGFIYAYAFLHFVALSLKLGPGAHFSGDTQVNLRFDYAHFNVHPPLKIH